MPWCLRNEEHWLHIKVPELPRDTQPLLAFASEALATEFLQLRGIADEYSAKPCDEDGPAGSERPVVVFDTREQLSTYFTQPSAYPLAALLHRRAVRLMR